MIIVIQNQCVFATHTDAQKADITFALYPFADAILQTMPGIRFFPGDPDPSLTHPEYVLTTTRQLAALYVMLTLSGGDGKTPILGLKLGHATRGTMTVTGDIRATPDTPGLPVNITFEWRITIRKIVSETTPTPIDSFPVDGCVVTNNQVSMTFDPAALGMSPGIYLISDEDFATIPGAAFGLASDYQVKLVGGNKFFKVLR